MDRNEQLSIDEIEAEIQRELGAPEAFGYEAPILGEERASRGEFRLKDFDNPRDKEMAVITHAKKLSEYIFVITEKSPKKFRWSIITRLHNCSVEVIEYLYRANFERDIEPRIAYQKRAATALKLLDFYAETARKKQAITIRQMGVIAKQIGNTEKLLNGWVKSSKQKG